MNASYTATAQLMKAVLGSQKSGNIRRTLLGNRLRGATALAVLMAAGSALAGGHHGGGGMGGSGMGSGGMGSSSMGSMRSGGSSLSRMQGPSNSFNSQSFSQRSGGQFQNSAPLRKLDTRIGSSLNKPSTPELGQGTLKQQPSRLGQVNKPSTQPLPGALGGSKLGRALDSSKGKIVDLSKKSGLPTGKLGKLDSTNLGKLKAATNQVAKSNLLNEHLAKQLRDKGDIARRLNLGSKLEEKGGWKNRVTGSLSKHYDKDCFSYCYCGPSYCPSHCWFPKWSPWVDWCYASYSTPAVVYQPCDTWVVSEYPAWQALPVAPSGTWVDVPAEPAKEGLDLQLLAVRFVDPGHPEKQLGPRYRVWLRNNSEVAIDQEFDVRAMAATTAEPVTGMPQDGVKVPSMQPGQVLTVDIRLPFEANSLAKDDEGNPAPFTSLHVLVDSQRQVAETNETNNGAVIPRGEVLPVDPAVFKADSESAAPGSVINVAGEGLGPEAGQIWVTVGETKVPAEIEGWYDLGVRVKLPALALAEAAEAKLEVTRGDGAISNELTLKLAAAETPQTAAAE